MRRGGGYQNVEKLQTHKNKEPCRGLAFKGAERWGSKTTGHIERPVLFLDACSRTCIAHRSNGQNLTSSYESLPLASMLHIKLGPAGVPSG
mmetsp:Transcript_90175/g.243579  ORF Transcript_90175/g.243579 Transcript_90175/m.243579 type:complete len:91 (+) Transcript_90175:386-658(+)